MEFLLNENGFVDVSKAFLRAVNDKRRQGPFEARYIAGARGVDGGLFKSIELLIDLQKKELELGSNHPDYAAFAEYSVMTLADHCAEVCLKVCSPAELKELVPKCPARSAIAASFKRDGRQNLAKIFRR